MDKCNIQDGYFYAVGDNNTVIVKAIKEYNENKRLMTTSLSMLSENFTGRGSYLFKIKSSLGKYGCIALVGNGGIGKTQIALKYIHDNKKQYEHIVFINASSYYSIKNDYSKILDIENDDNVICYMKHWSSLNKNWLFVYDNLDNMELKSNFFKQYMVDPSNGDIIITSRLSNWDRKIYVSAFDKLESIEFLSKKTLKYDRQRSEFLSNQLGNFPLALEQAGAYIKNSFISYEEYSQLFQNYTNRLNLLGVEKPDSYHSTTLKTWSLSFSSISNQAAIDLLNIVSFFSQENIPVSLFEDGKNFLPDQLKNQFEDKLSVINLFRELSNYSLIRYDGEQFYIHNLVQDVIRLNLVQDKWCSIAFQLFYNTFDYNCYNKNSWNKNISLIPHILSVCEYYQDTIGQCIELMMLYHNVANLYCQRGMYEDSMLLYKYVLKKTKEKFKNESNIEIFISKLYNSLAVLYSDIGNLKKSEKMFKESISIREKLFGKNHEITAQSYNGLATLYITLKKYDIAEELLKKVIIIRKKMCKRNPCYIGATYNNLAILYYHLKSYCESEKMYKKVIDIWEKNLEKDNLLLAAAYNNIAILYINIKEFMSAEIFYKKSIEIYYNKLGCVHPYLAISYNNFAELYFISKNYKEAEIYYKKSLDIFNNTFGIKNKYSISSYSNLVKLYKKLNIYPERKALLDTYFSKSTLTSKSNIKYPKVFFKYGNEIKPIYKNSLIYTPLTLIIAFVKLNSKKITIAASATVGTIAIIAIIARIILPVSQIEEGVDALKVSMSSITVISTMSPTTIISGTISPEASPVNLSPLIILSTITPSTIPSTMTPSIIPSTVTPSIIPSIVTPSATSSPIPAKPDLFVTGKYLVDYDSNSNLAQIQNIKIGNKGNAAANSFTIKITALGKDNFFSVNTLGYGKTYTVPLDGLEYISIPFSIIVTIDENNVVEENNENNNSQIIEIRK
jgi:tetratricopeptide (TPR) repeat protein